jgi:hypothetical protein
MRRVQECPKTSVLDQRFGQQSLATLRRETYLEPRHEHKKQPRGALTAERNTRPKIESLRNRA